MNAPHGLAATPLFRRTPLSMRHPAGMNRHSTRKIPSPLLWLIFILLNILALFSYLYLDFPVLSYAVLLASLVVEAWAVCRRR